MTEYHMKLSKYSDTIFSIENVANVQIWYIIPEI